MSETKACQLQSRYRFKGQTIAAYRQIISLPKYLLAHRQVTEKALQSAKQYISFPNIQTSKHTLLEIFHREPKKCSGNRVPIELYELWINKRQIIFYIWKSHLRVHKRLEKFDNL